MQKMVQVSWLGPFHQNIRLTPFYDSNNESMYKVHKYIYIRPKLVPFDSTSVVSLCSLHAHTFQSLDHVTLTRRLSKFFFPKHNAHTNTTHIYEHTYAATLTSTLERLNWHISKIDEVTTRLCLICSVGCGYSCLHFGLPHDGATYAVLWDCWWG
jgi:hypothetical protein